MYPYAGIEDTIVAIATPMGQGGLGIIRLSGQQALAIADQMFIDRKGQQPSQFKTFTVHYGDVLYPQTEPSQAERKVVDEALLTVMRAPKTYTREDVVEISCHGGLVVLESILKIAISHGSRLAEPGEFTKRAFLNGRIDLTQAEAVLDIISSKTDKFLQVSTHQLKGDLSLTLEAIREQLMQEYVRIEALVNFPEEEIEDQGRLLMRENLQSARDAVKELIDSSSQGRILKEGLKFVLCGRPNVGKSSILNVLLRQPRAIVSPVPGTTRDTIEEVAHIRGIPIQLVDTAGILEPRDAIEQEAVKRSHMHRQSADIVALVLDRHQPLTQEDHDIIKALIGQNVIVLLNKCDLSSGIERQELQKIFPDAPLLDISALQKIGFEALELTITEQLYHNTPLDEYGLLISNLRHIQALQRCLAEIEAAVSEEQRHLSLEFISEQIKSAVSYLDQITGREIDIDLIDQIFSQFCIGK